MRALILPIIACLAACQTTDDALRAQYKPWIGRSLRDYAAANSIVPERLDARTWIFNEPRALGSCRRTVEVDAGGAITSIEGR